MRCSGSYLHLNVKDASAVLLGDVANSLDAGAVVVAAELGVLDETTLIDQLQEVLLCDKVVFDAILLGASGLASSVLCVYNQSLVSIKEMVLSCSYERWRSRSGRGTP